MGLNCYSASYSIIGSYGFYEERELVVVANTEQEALGLALEESPESLALHWTIEKIETSEPSVRYISSRSS